MKTKVLVTGATGFLGGFLVRRLLDLSFDVSVLIRNKDDFEEFRTLGCHIVEGDVLKPQKLDFKSYEGVFHLAALISAFPSDRKNLIAVNVTGTKNILETAIRDKVKKFIHLSSVVAVGTNLSETDPLLNENSPNITIGLGHANYDSKRLGEELVLKAARENKINATVLNPGLIYGPGDAKKPMRKGNVLAAKGKLGVYPPGGVNIVSVYDVVEAVITAFRKGRNGERYLLTGSNITARELLCTIAEFAEKKAPQKIFPSFLKSLARIFDGLKINSQLNNETIFSTSTFHWYDNKKAMSELNFNPRSYKEAIKSSVDWMITNKYLEK